MQQLQSEVTRHGHALSLAQLEAQIVARQEELEHVTGLAEAAQQRHETELARMREARKGVRDELRQLQQEQELLAQVETPRDVKIAARRQQVAALVAEGKDEAEIAAAVGVSLRTVQRDVAAVSVNGKEHIE